MSSGFATKAGHFRRFGPTQDQTSAAIPIQRVARFSRNVGQPDHILANPVIGHKAERRPGPGEIWFAVTKHDGVQVDSILINQAKFGEASRQVRASNFDLPVALGLQHADRAVKIILNERGVGATDFNERETTHFGWFRLATAKACSSTSHSG